MKYNAVHHLIQPNNVAIIGASQQRENVGRLLLKNYMQNGYNITCINKRQVPGVKTVQHISELPKQDLVIIAVPASSLNNVINDVRAANPGAIQVITAGIEEFGKNIPTHSSSKLIQGSNCLGNVINGKNLTFLKYFKPKQVHENSLTNAAIISQSGAFLSTLSQEIGVGAGLSIGNQSELTFNDYLSQLCEEKYEIIILYLENISTRELDEACEIMNKYQNKNFVIYKNARSQHSSLMSSQHTGHQEGVTYEQFKQQIRQLPNVKIINNINDLIAYTQLYQYGLIKQGNLLNYDIKHKQRLHKLENTMINQQNITPVKLHCVSQSGYIAGTLAHYLKHDIIEPQNEYKNKVAKIFKDHNIPAHVRGNLDTTPQISMDQLISVCQVMLNSIIQQSKEQNYNGKLIIGLLSELYSDDDIQKLCNFIEQNKHNIIVTVEDHQHYSMLLSKGIQCIFRVDSLKFVNQS